MFIMRFLQISEIIKKNFLQELRDANAGKTTSLRFIKHVLPTEKLVSDDEVFQVLVVGGTVFRKALLKKVREQLIFLDEYSEKHPDFSSKNSFLEYISKQMYPDINTVAINFAFPLVPQARDGRLDGKLLTETKETPFEGLMGEFIGLTIEQYVANRYSRYIHTFVLNDAICLLLSGPNESELGFTAGAIMGTGTNMSFSYEGLAINLESGNFDKFALSNECLEIDASSDQLRSSLFEKETAGGYLYKHFNYFIHKNQVVFEPISSTLELQVIALDNRNVKAQSLARDILEKSGAYFAGQIAGLTAFKNHDMTFIVEGGMYWENDLYQKFVGDYLKILSPEFEIKILKVDNSSIIGAANLLT